ncbi:MAG: hypothetical protein K2M91_04555 [Lachnospiraceae bacterium]|nr:hypothetical protein [Lachnospiraceae bacterium]
MSGFKIDGDHFAWINGEADDPKDLCLHGDVTAVIGDECFTDECTVSATALYLLKTLTEDHVIWEDNQMMPCCGHFIIPNDDLSEVTIVGCPNGIDWSVIHEGASVKLITESGKETVVPVKDYAKKVFRFADKVEAYYQLCSPKIISENEFYQNGYTAFWNEWHRRREFVP